ncbi:MAG: HAMP domain-containing histidine kinase [Candidatus Pacebacteria bacterium]|nr:HAMP domain-containing histidine kinase [Candidatus Paceibacterota bacterium]
MKDSENIEAQKNYLRILNHDIRSPLASIIGFSKLLQEDDISLEKVKKFATAINNVGESMLKMANNYLLLEKIENGSTDIEKDQYTIFQLIHLIKKIGLDLKLSDRIVFPFYHSSNSYFINLIRKKVLINESLFESVIINLFKNADEASSANEDKILININEKDNKFYINISNQGEIPEEIKKNLFQKFNTSKSFGKGLGLYSAKLIVEAHGGKLTCKSLSNATSFMVEIPFDE